MDSPRSPRAWMRALAILRSRAARFREQAASSPQGGEAIALLNDALELADLLRIECADLQQKNVTLQQRLERLLNVLPHAVVATDGAGTIVEANRAAAALLARSALHLRGEPLMYLTEDREDFSALIRRFSESESLNARLRLRPYNRAPFDATITIVPDPDDSGNRLWFLNRVAKAAVPTKP
jgi:PAS domain-containing protein